MIPITTSPDIEWLQRKWALPEQAVSAVETLLAQEADGSTACLLPALVADWGKAAVVSNSEETSITPLVLVEYQGNSYLQSRRLYEAEQGITTRLLAMANETSPWLDSEKRLVALFSPTSGENRQAQAARIAKERQLTIITGGPGTGKTYTLARILALLLAEGMEPAPIRLAAPTGKASDRMKAAITASLAELPAEFQRLKNDLVRIADSSSTLHKLLGYNPQQGRTRFNQNHTLPCAVLIIDECSMVDVSLWQATLEALPPTAKLILLGDPNQLESVGQGSVFSELTRTAKEPHSPLHPSLVHLTEARRFKNRPGILVLAQALEASDPDVAIAILQDQTPASTGLTWIESQATSLPFAKFPESIRKALEEVATAETPAQALSNLSKVCILTAQREYYSGALALNQSITKALRTGTNFRNEPIIINHNDPETGLRNGTVGVIYTGTDGKRTAYFYERDEQLKDIAIAKLPEYSPAWAITIHRSQGSEYNDVLVILPKEESPMATRELLYTAITRAKENVFVVGNLETIKKATLTSSNRITLLAAAIQQGNP